MKPIAIRALVGLGLGVGFAILEFVVLGAAERIFHDHTVQPMRFFNLVFGILNAPAEWLGYIWIDILHLPPRSELAWVLVPVVTVLMQWGLIGFLGGLWWGFKSATSVSVGKSNVWPVVLVGGGIIVVCGFLAFILGEVFSSPAKPTPEQAKIISDIKKLGGTVLIGEEGSGRPGFRVCLNGDQVTDEALVLVKRLTTDCPGLVLMGDKVNDAILERLRKIPDLRWLVLAETNVTDAGLKHLEVFNQLEMLGLDKTSGNRSHPREQ